MAKPSLVVLAVEGLRASALGAYGATGYSTPALDELAALGTTFEWCYSPVAERAETYNLLWSAMHTLADGYGDGRLVSDDPLAIDQRWRHAFAVLYERQIAPPTARAESIAETHLAKVFAQFSEVLVDATPPYDNTLIWLHTKGLAGVWDAPRELATALCEEDDPEPYAGLLAPPVAQVNAEEAFGIASAYAAQVQVLDACVAALQGAIAELSWGPIDFCLLGLSGFALGEHGSVGHADERLYSEQHHVPAIVVRASAAGAFTRSRELVSLDKLLVQRLNPRANEPPIVLTSPSRAQVLRTAEWLLRRASASSPPELYAKPDDRWEANNVADRLPEVTAELQAELEKPCERLPEGFIRGYDGDPSTE